jgi:hypothetical protein
LPKLRENGKEELTLKEIVDELKRMYCELAE